MRPINSNNNDRSQFIKQDDQQDKPRMARQNQAANLNAVPKYDTSLVNSSDRAIHLLYGVQFPPDDFDPPEITPYYAIVKPPEDNDPPQVTPKYAVEIPPDHTDPPEIVAYYAIVQPPEDNDPPQVTLKYAIELPPDDGEVVVEPDPPINNQIIVFLQKLLELLLSFLSSFSKDTKLNND